MPALPAISTGALEDLAQQLRFAPPRTVLTQVDRLEELAATIDPDAWYDETELVQRITGYRPEIEAPAMLAGVGLLRDLSALCERLTAPLKLDPQGLSVDELRARWSVSRKTIDRYRRLGLLARRARNLEGRTVLDFRVPVVERFEQRLERASPGKLEAASAFERSSSGRIVALADRYRRRLSLDPRRDRAAITARLIERWDVGHGSEPQRRAQVMLALRSAWGPMRSVTPGTLGSLGLRAAERGIGALDVAERRGVGERAVARAAAEVTRLRLEAEIPAVDAPREALGAHRAAWPEMPQALGSMLGVMRDAPRPDRRLGAELGGDLRAHLARARTAEAGPLAADFARVAALRAVRLAAQLAWLERRTVFEAVESSFGKGLEHLGTQRGSSALAAGMQAAAREALRWDPSGRGTLSARISVAVTRREAAERGVTDDGRARPAFDFDAAVPEWWWGIARWQRWAEPSVVVRRGVGVLGPDAPPSRLIEMRFGVRGAQPLTLDEVAEAIGKNRPRAAVLIREAVRAAFLAGLGGDS